MLLPEYEIAWCMQDLAMEHLGYYITETEILHLAEIIGGALEFYAETHPEFKLRTVICCHMNMPAAWALKRKVLAAFDKYLKVIALLPVNAKDVRGFSDADLILTTVRKKLTDRTDVKVIRIGAFLPSQDYWKISEYIRDYRIERLYPLNDELTGNLWKNLIVLVSSAYAVTVPAVASAPAASAVARIHVTVLLFMFVPPLWCIFLGLGC